LTARRFYSVTHQEASFMWNHDLKVERESLAYETRLSLSVKCEQVFSGW
jgi:hypothetical protein